MEDKPAAERYGIRKIILKCICVDWKPEKKETENLKERVIKQPGEKDTNKQRLQEGEAAERQREMPRGKIPSPDKVRTDRKKCWYLGQSSSQNRTQSSPLFRVGNGKSSFNNFHHFFFPFFLLPPSKPSTAWRHFRQIKQYANTHVNKNHHLCEK